MNLSEATAHDTAQINGFLSGHSETSMFLRGNLAAHGIGERCHRHGTTYWLWGRDPIRAVLGVTNGGYVMCQAPQADDAFWQAAADALTGQTLHGMTGVPQQIEALMRVLGLPEAAFSLDNVEPLYSLTLSELATPADARLLLREPVQSDVAMLGVWFDGYASDTGLSPTGESSGAASAIAFCAHPAARILCRDGVAVAMTSLNAQLDDIVQIGGVYVPPELRGQGLAGTAVALQLAQQRSAGVQRAILFAANAGAARAYEKIGFDHIGSYRICLLKTPTVIERAAHVL